MGRFQGVGFQNSATMLRQRLEVSDDGHPLATAEVSTAGSGGTARVSLHAEPGHTTPGCHASLVDAVLDLPEVQQSARLEAAFPLGDSESLLRLQERCQDGSTHPAGSSALFKADLPARRASRTSPAQPAGSLWTHNACMEPLRPPQGVLADGVVSLRVPSAGDVDAFVRYAAGHDGGPGGAWLPVPYAGASRERCLWMVADWLAGWAGEGSYKGPALLLTVAQSPEPVGMVGFVCGGGRARSSLSSAWRRPGGAGAWRPGPSCWPLRCPGAAPALAGAANDSKLRRARFITPP